MTQTLINNDTWTQTGFSGRKPNSLGLRMAGAKNLRKMKPLIAVYPTSSCISKEMGGVNILLLLIVTLCYYC